MAIIAHQKYEVCDFTTGVRVLSRAEKQQAIQLERDAILFLHYYILSRREMNIFISYMFISGVGIW